MENRENGIYMSQQTLSALKNALFSENGIDLSGIVNDLCPTEEGRDLFAINIALAYRKVPFDFDKTPRKWCGNVYHPTSFSLIMGTVFAESEQDSLKTAFPIGEWERFEKI